MKLPPLSLYIHYPWCVKKCPYCDFNSHEKSDKTFDKANYIQMLLNDLEDDLTAIQRRKIQTIFIGGGTPSLMSVDELSALFDGLQAKLSFAEDIEITLETNPSSFEMEKFSAFKTLGINRLSIGVQSFNDEHLQALGRIHSAQEAIDACNIASQVGFDNVNIDLMYGIQNQTLSESLADVAQAIKLSPSHLSFYQLTIEANTLFAKFPPILPKQESLWKMGKRGAKLLERHGYRCYEVSAFSKTPAKHNLNYWQFGDYIGIGAGAHGKITQTDGTIIRTLKIKSPKDYLKNPQKSTRIIDNIPFEFMLNALRLKVGFTVSLFESRTGQSIQSVATQLKKAQALDLLDINQHRIKPSQRGFDFLNDLQALFL